MFYFFPGRSPSVGQRWGRGQGGGGRERGEGRSKVIVVFWCQLAISCCRVTALSLDAWRRSGVSCCPGTPAETRPAPTPESHRPPSPSDLNAHTRTQAYKPHVPTAVCHVMDSSGRSRLTLCPPWLRSTHLCVSPQQEQTDHRTRYSTFF